MSYALVITIGQSAGEVLIMQGSKVVSRQSLAISPYIGTALLEAIESILGKNHVFPTDLDYLKVNAPEEEESSAVRSVAVTIDALSLAWDMPVKA
jgi:hypothetical protein